jgi:glyoxylase-like metal-dependent hydrolase (beta-lactamase superfamily II)
VKVVPLHAGNPGPFTGEGNWTYLIPGEHALLIDAGVGNDTHLDAIAGAVPHGPADVVVTHVHSDHATGAPVIHRRWPSASFHKWPWPAHDAKFDVRWNDLSAGQRFETGEGALEVVHTPGHSPDHVCLWNAESRTIFVGDLLIQSGTVFIPASSGGNLTDYLASLERLRRLEPRRAWPAHGPVIEDPIALITRYVAHRQEREEQVLEAIRSGLETVEAITDRIYAGHGSAVIPMARESVLAHLVKLSDEGRAETAEGGHWRLKD